MKSQEFTTIEEFISYRNKILSKAKQRTLKFNDKGYNYYWIRLEEIDNAYPQFKGLGIVRFKYDIKKE